MNIENGGTGELYQYIISLCLWLNLADVARDVQEVLKWEVQRRNVKMQAACNSSPLFDCLTPMNEGACGVKWAETLFQYRFCISFVVNIW